MFLATYSKRFIRSMRKASVFQLVNRPEFSAGIKGVAGFSAHLLK